MNDSRLLASFPGLLAGHLAKLNHQLRHLRANGLDPSLGSAAGPSHSVVKRLQVAAMLLSDPDACRGAEQASLQRLGLVLGELLTGLDETPTLLPAYLLTPLGHLAEFLTEAFDRLDAGEEPALLCRDVRWETLLAAFINAGTVLQGLDEVEDRLLAWSRRYADKDLSPSQELALQHRWALLREFGDSLFGVAGQRAASEDLTGRRVMLLLDSPFRQAQLGERLREAGCLVETSGDPGGMMARVGDPLPPEILLCDNLEPSLHLVTVRARLEALRESERPHLVLVAAAGGTPQKLRDRAKHLGAQGTWADPFHTADLAAALA
jgi:hypothetical protein